VVLVCGFVGGGGWGWVRVLGRGGGGRGGGGGAGGGARRPPHVEHAAKTSVVQAKKGVTELIGGA
jgi:hypothetical protein